MGIKVYDFCCGFGHVFEGWYRSEEEMEDDLRMGRVACPVCGDPSVSRRPSAPNFGKVSGTTRTDVEADARLAQLAGDSKEAGGRHEGASQSVGAGRGCRQPIS